MILGKKLLAVVPARSGSKGLQGKNVRIFREKPLLQWSVEHGLGSQFVDKVIVSTDSEEIATVARQCGATVPFIRPWELATDTATSIDVLMHSIDFMEKNGDFFDLVVMLEPTSPLRSSKDIDTAVQMLIDDPSAESVVSVSKVESHHPSFLMKKSELNFISPYLENFKILRRQEISPLFFLDGTVYVSWIESLRKRKSFYHDNTLGYEVPKYKSFEIDDFDDFIICEALHKFKFSEKE